MLIYEYIAFTVIVFILVQKNHVSIIKLTYHKISSDKTQNHNLREDRLWFAKTTLFTDSFLHQFLNTARTKLYRCAWMELSP
jgi:hypothetical protein